MILEKKFTIDQVASEDPNASTDWIHRHYDDIFRLLRHLTRQHETAEDLTQQTFILAHRGWHRFRHQSSIKTWLYRIAFREYISWRRKRKILLPLTVLGGKPDAGFSGVETELFLLQALHQLPSAQREVFLLHEVEQLGIQEISEVTGIKEGTIKSHLFYARKHLRTAFGEPNQEESK